MNYHGSQWLSVNGSKFKESGALKTYSSPNQNRASWFDRRTWYPGSTPAVLGIEPWQSGLSDACHTSLAVGCYLNPGALLWSATEAELKSVQKHRMAQAGTDTSPKPNDTHS